MGTVVTFYSYKGGVGRSMALANIAILLAKEGKRVLAIDWDLEAPGLERYFQSSFEVPMAPGLLQLLGAAAGGGRPDPADYAVDIDVESGTPVTLIASGREAAPIEYGALLEGFDWRRFFEDGGGDYLEELRAAWKRDYDIVLIDSRTGLTDTGGVCTIQLPDVVVVMFTTNYQSLLGARDVMQHVREARQELAYPRMQLTVFPLPSRFATAAEFEESKRWLERIGREFAEFYEDWLPASAEPLEVLQRVKVPQKDYFSFGEKLPVIEEGVADPTGMGYAYDQVARVLVDDFEATDEVLGLRERTREPPPVVDDYLWNVFVSFPPGPSLQLWVDEFIDLVRAEMEAYRDPAIFLQHRELTLGPSLPAAVQDALRRSRLLLAIVTPEYVRSRWTLAEFATFVERERTTGAESLIVPVLFRGRLEELPHDYSDRAQTFDARRYPITGRLSREPDVMRDVQRLVEWMLRRLDSVPPFRPDFPVVDPSDVEMPKPTEFPFPS